MLLLTREKALIPHFTGFFGNTACQRIVEHMWPGIGPLSTQQHLHLVDVLGWRDGALAHMKHPENEHRAVPGHHPGEEGDLGNPGRLPAIVLHSRSRNDAHVDDQGQESLKLCDGDGIPLQKAAVLL